jgi:hypothetical protein
LVGINPVVSEEKISMWMGDEIKKKIFSSETTEPISTRLCSNDPWVVPFQNCVRHHGPVSKMAANHPMTISLKFCSYWANGFRQEDFYGNFP